MLGVWSFFLVCLLWVSPSPTASFSPHTTATITIMAPMTGNSGSTTTARRRRPPCTRSSNGYSALEASSSSSSSSEAEGTTTIVSSSATPFDIESCEVGINTVENCQTIPATQSQLGATTNLAKCICGAGSFALPHVFLQQGLIGGTIALTVCGGLASYTMKSLAHSKALLTTTTSNTTIRPITSYVELANVALGKRASQLVFTLTLCAALGVCSTYLVFIGQTLESMSTAISDGSSISAAVGAVGGGGGDPENLIRQFFPDVTELTFEVVTALILIPLCLIRDYSIFAFTSALGVIAVVGGMAVTIASGILVDPGWDVAVTSFSELRLWPISYASAFGTSFGTIAYLFCINFLTFPILNSLQEPKDYDGAVTTAVSGVWFFNVLFAIGCLAFYGNDTQDLVLANLGNGPYLSALKLFLCVDLLFTFPIVFSSGRQILQTALLDQPDADDAAIPRALIVTTAVAACLGLAQIGGFGAVANLVGGVAQGTLAFVLPPTIAITLARRSSTGNESSSSSEIGQWMVGSFGVLVVTAVTYFTIESMVVPT